MWYTGDPFMTLPKILRIGHATSNNGINWTKDINNPVLDKGPTGSWDEKFVHVAEVMVIANTYHMYYAGKRGNTIDFNIQIGHATSPDGTIWTKDLIILFCLQEHLGPGIMHGLCLHPYYMMAPNTISGIQVVMVQNLVLKSDMPHPPMV